MQGPCEPALTAVLVIDNSTKTVTTASIYIALTSCTHVLASLTYELLRFHNNLGSQGHHFICVTEKETSLKMGKLPQVMQEGREPGQQLESLAQGNWMPIATTRWGPKASPPLGEPLDKTTAMAATWSVNLTLTESPERSCNAGTTR